MSYVGKYPFRVSAVWIRSNAAKDICLQANNGEVLVVPRALALEVNRKELPQLGDDLRVWATLVNYYNAYNSKLV